MNADALIVLGLILVILAVGFLGRNDEWPR